jgi:hypothetical protein
MIETLSPAAALGPLHGRAVILFVGLGDKGGTRTEVWCYPILGERVPDTAPYINDVPAAIARARLLGSEFGRDRIQMLYDDSSIFWRPKWQQAA